MLGNFSLVITLKRRYSICLGFCDQELKIPVEKLWVTVFEEDDEAADIWLNDIGINSKQFVRCGKASNFWAMGDTGPCEYVVRFL